MVDIEDCQCPLIPLGHGFFTIVDADVFLWAQNYDWRAVKSAGSWYALRRIIVGGKYHYFRLHREIMQCPEGMEVHHINGNSLDNRRCNLICVTPEEHKRIENSGL